MQRCGEEEVTDHLDFKGNRVGNGGRGEGRRRKGSGKTEAAKAEGRRDGHREPPLSPALTPGGWWREGP